MTSIASGLRERLHFRLLLTWRSFFNDSESDSLSNPILINDSPLISNGNGSVRDQGRLNTDYTELMGGSVPCPSCNGSGLIPKELEETLVALIPVNDERLKPNKTWMYIVLWIGVCILIGGSILFLLMPRTVTLDSNHMPIELVTVYGHKMNKSEINFYFLNKVNISSGNYLPVNIVNITATIISKFQPWSSDLVGYGMNDTVTQIDPLPLYRSTKELLFNSTVALKGVPAEYCQAPFSHLTSLYVGLRFDIAVTLRYYYGHQEQVTISTQQQVCCIPSGNCTTS